MRDVTATYRDGRDAHLSNIYIRNDFNFVIYKTTHLFARLSNKMLDLVLCRRLC